MKYLKSRSQFIENRRNKLITEEKKYNLILEGGLENTINWGDSVVGRLFASMFRIAKMGVDLKRIDGAGNALRKLFADATKDAFKNPESKSRLENKLKIIDSVGYVETLIDKLETAEIQDIQNYIKLIPNEVTKEVLSIISNGYDFNKLVITSKRDQEVIDVLLSIESWTKKEESTKSEEREVITKTIDNDLQNDIINNMKMLKEILLTQKNPPKYEYKRGDKVIHNGREATFVSSKSEYGPGPDNKIPTNDDTIEGELKPGESFITMDGEEGMVVKTKELKKKGSSIIENFIFNLNENNSIDLKEITNSLKKMSIGLDINSKLKEGEETNLKPISIDWLINNSRKRNSLLNIYKIIHLYIKEGSNLDTNSMYNKVKDEYIKNRSNKIPGQGTRPAIWRECVTAKKISDFYKSILKFNDYKQLGNIGVLLEKYKESMNSILSRIDNMSKESIYVLNEAVFIDDENKKDENIDISVEKNETITNIIKNSDNKQDYKEWFDLKITPIRKKLNLLLKDADKDIEELNKEAEKNIYILDVIEIIKIFKKASRLYIKTRIPSNRTGGKITTARANNWEKTDGGTVDPDRPDGGPFRNIKLYEKWSKIVLDIVNEYDYMLKRDTSMVRLSDNSTPIKPQKSIYDFIIDALEGDKISGVSKGMKSESNQLEFLKGYFGENAKKVVGKFGEKEYDFEEDKKVESSSLFKEVNEINTYTSNLYKLTTSGYLLDGSKPIADRKSIYLYFRKNKEGRSIYLFEDDDIIKGRFGSKLRFDYESTSSTPDYFFMSKISEKNGLKVNDIINDFDVVKESGKDSVIIKSNNFKIIKIESYDYKGEKMILNFPINGFDSMNKDKNKIKKLFK